MAKRERDSRVRESPPPSLSTVSSLDQAFRSLQRSSELLDNLEFANGAVLPRTVLSGLGQFETTALREVLPHENGLFQSNKPTLDSWTDETEGTLDDGDKWTATKRRAPKRIEVGKEKASPLKDRQNKPAAQSKEDPDRCLRAAQKLLEIYPFPRASEHVEALHSQWLGVVDSIEELEAELRQPLARPGPAVQHDESYYRLLSLEDEIKREELELFALEQFKQDRETELAALKPAPTRRPGAAARKVPSVVARSQPGPADAPATRKDRPTPPPTGGDATRASPVSRPRSRVSSTSIRVADSSKAPEPVRRTRPSIPSAVPTPRAVAAQRKSLGAVQRSGDSTSAGTKSRSGSPSSPSACPAATRTALPRNTLPDGIVEEDLEAICKLVWRRMGDTLKPWGMKWAREQGRDGQTGDDGFGIKDTIKTLESVLNATFTRDPSSPSSTSISSYATSQAAEDGSEPMAPSPSTLVEFKLLNLLLTVISRSSPPTLPPSLPSLPIIFRDPPADSSTSPSSPTSKTPCLSMTGLKAHLGAYAVGKGWTEGMGTTAIYALISKQVTRIDRRGKEGPAVGFKV
ncbi:hypothetical protein JCM16303_003448 [Sporobolomyces ruberrimus]